MERGRPRRFTVGGRGFEPLTSSVSRRISHNPDLRFSGIRPGRRLKSDLSVPAYSDQFSELPLHPVTPGAPPERPSMTRSPRTSWKARARTHASLAETPEVGGSTGGADLCQDPTTLRLVSGYVSERQSRRSFRRRCYRRKMQLGGDRCGTSSTTCYKPAKSLRPSRHCQGCGDAIEDHFSVQILSASSRLRVSGM